MKIVMFGSRIPPIFTTTSAICLNLTKLAFLWNISSDNSWTIYFRFIESWQLKAATCSFSPTTKLQQPISSDWQVKLVKITVTLSTVKSFQQKSTLSPHFSSRKVPASLKISIILANKWLTKLVACSIAMFMIFKWKLNLRKKSKWTWTKKMDLRTLLKRKQKPTESTRQSSKMNKKRKIFRCWCARTLWCTLTLSSKVHPSQKSSSLSWKLKVTLLENFTSVGLICLKHLLSRFQNKFLALTKKLTNWL